MERGLRSMDNQTIIKARSIGGVEFAKHNVSSFYLLDDILKEAKRSKELSGLVHRGLDLYLGERCVAVFTPAGNDLLVAIAAPHAVPAMDVSMKKFRTLHLLPEEEGDSNDWRRLPQRGGRGDGVRMLHMTQRLPHLFNFFSLMRN
ncbi:Hypothetical protein, putative [Bodo saltans]|uniref:Uncharacterized protein n=1 Tax=Bodo saltans TaxID=75058 RepID=A0A0S4JQV6_BODSA|nr:Hypothetical protein, putative [Bodo saltans]|eukprot:CUG91692.1 Hypothetical protein, putative [Bodo saltans]